MSQGYVCSGTSYEHAPGGDDITSRLLHAMREDHDSSLPMACFLKTLSSFLDMELKSGRPNRRESRQIWCIKRFTALVRAYHQHVAANLQKICRQASAGSQEERDLAGGFTAWCSLPSDGEWLLELRHGTIDLSWRVVFRKAKRLRYDQSGRIKCLP